MRYFTYLINVEDGIYKEGGGQNFILLHEKVQAGGHFLSNNKVHGRGTKSRKTIS